MSFKIVQVTSVHKKNLTHFYINHRPILLLPVISVVDAITNGSVLK